MQPQLEPSWLKVLQGEFESEYFASLKQFLVDEINAKKIIYPPPAQIFHAFEACSFNDVKVVILGQDPYHGKDQAHGLCFSVNKGVKIPPSLQNIYKELHADVGTQIPNHGFLDAWAQQGVLLLNAVLTVRASSAASHAGKGWEQFTTVVIEQISEQKENIVFLLWGRYAQQKGAIIDRNKHLVLEAAHPSPFSAHNGFFGCKHFSKANAYLVEHEKQPIDWQISE
jgi:uracil-DNA glycosylase